jgi:hypothetical protein
VPRVILVLGVLVVVAIGAVALALLSRFDDREDARGAVTAVLSAAAQDRWEDAWNATSPQFRASTSLEEFREDVETRRESIGRFEQIGDVHAFRMAADGGDAVLHADVVHERGRWASRFRLVRDGEEWRLLSWAADGDEGIEAEARRLLDLWSEGDFAAIRERFSADLRSTWPQSQFEQEMRSRREVLGAVREVFDPEVDPAASSVHFPVAFERAEGSATFAFMDEDGRLRLVALRIERDADAPR